MNKHDKVGRYGFDVEPNHLAHDLTLLKLSKLDIPSDDWQLYDLYTETYHSLKAIIDDKTRYDSSFKTNL